MRCFRSAFGAYGEAIPETRHSNMVRELTIGNQTRVNSLLAVGPMVISAAKIACHCSDRCNAVKLQSVWQQAPPCKHFSHVPLTLTVDLIVYISPSSLDLNGHHILSYSHPLIIVPVTSILQPLLSSPILCVQSHSKHAFHSLCHRCRFLQRSLCCFRFVSPHVVSTNSSNTY